MPMILSLGTNLGNKKKNLEDAIQKIEQEFFVEEKSPSLPFEGRRLSGTTRLL